MTFHPLYSHEMTTLKFRDSQLEYFHESDEAKVKRSIEFRLVTLSRHVHHPK